MLSKAELLAEAWQKAKEAEKAAQEERRRIEDELCLLFQHSEQEVGTKNYDVSGHKVKIVSRLNYKIDADLLQDLAEESGLSEHLSTIFRWKPELNLKVWESAHEEITKVLSKAITATPSRPSFTIEKE